MKRQRLRSASGRIVRRFFLRRDGVAAVEFAVCLPVILLLVFGSIEASSFIFLKQSLNSAAYEGVRAAIRSGADSGEGIERATAILNARGVSDFVVDFPSGDAGSSERGEEVVITVSAPTGSNRPIAGQFLADRVIVARVVMVKE